MTSPGAVFGDTEAAVIAILRAAAPVGTMNATVSSDLIGYTTAARWLRVLRTGGVPTLWMALDNADIRIEAYAERKAVALDLANAARVAVFAARGVYAGNGLRLYDVVDLDGLTWDPDPKTPSTPRYVLSLAVLTRPGAP
jgi:hypothetical protein